MFTKSVIAAALLAASEARFGQQGLPMAQIAIVVGGPPGQAETIAGESMSDLQIEANACAKLQRADQIVQELGTEQDAMDAAISMVVAEQNYDPLSGELPRVCSDPSLPETPELRGIMPLVDPAVPQSQIAIEIAIQTSTEEPLDAQDMSVADLLVQVGFTAFVAQDLEGNMINAAVAVALDAGASQEEADAAGQELVDQIMAEAMGVAEEDVADEEDANDAQDEIDAAEQMAADLAAAQEEADAQAAHPAAEEEAHPAAAEEEAEAEDAAMAHEVNVDATGAAPEMPIHVNVAMPGGAVHVNVNMTADAGAAVASDVAVAGAAHATEVAAAGAAHATEAVAVASEAAMAEHKKRSAVPFWA